MAINSAIRLVGFVLLAGLAAPALSAQEATDQIGGGGLDSFHSATAALPARLAENPPKAPKVTCDGDQLTISANNATLGSVLAAVHACIGVQIDIPSGAGGGRTFEELGPGPARQVLETLLSGTDFNYVIGSSDADPGKIETVLLLERKAEVAANAAPIDRSTAAGRRAWMESMRNASRSGSTAEVSQPTEEPAETSAVEDTPATPALAAAPPADATNANAGQPPASDTPAAPVADAPPAPPAAAEMIVAPSSGSPAPELSPSVGMAPDSGKSTADRISEMQQMFAQRRQIQAVQSQSPANGQTQP